MSNYNSLLNPEGAAQQDKQKRKTFLIICLAIFIPVIAITGWLFLKRNTDKVYGALANNSNKESIDPMADKARNTILSYLATPRFAGRNLEIQILGSVHLELYDLDKQEIYFSHPEIDAKTKESKNSLDLSLEKFIIDQKRIEMAKEQGDILKLGRFSLPKSAEKAIFFKTPVENIKVAPDTPLQFSFQRGLYKITVDQLSNFVSNKDIYGGKLEAIAESTKEGKLIFANHGVMVAKPNNLSLKNFVQDLTKNISPDDSMAREKRIQRVLDLVTSEIEYDQTEALSGYETLKRPNETLMNRGADCSNKAILMASLLEQMNEDYLLLYCPKHITVAVKQGQFPKTNGLTFNWQGNNYVIAETTAAGFKIGVDHLKKESILHNIEFVQRPSERDLIFNVNTGAVVEFR